MSDKPVQTIRIGSIKATVWENRNGSGQIFYATTISRTYKDDSDQWKESNSYLPDDLPKMELAARKAFEFVHSMTPDRKADSYTEKLEQERAEKSGRKSASKAAG